MATKQTNNGDAKAKVEEAKARAKEAAIKAKAEAEARKEAEAKIVRIEIVIKIDPKPEKQNTPFIIPIIGKLFEWDKEVWKARVIVSANGAKVAGDDNIMLSIGTVCGDIIHMQDNIAEFNQILLPPDTVITIKATHCKSGHAAEKKIATEPIGIIGKIAKFFLGNFTKPDLEEEKK